MYQTSIRRILAILPGKLPGYGLGTAVLGRAFCLLSLFRRNCSRRKSTLPRSRWQLLPAVRRRS